MSKFRVIIEGDTWAEIKARAREVEGKEDLMSTLNSYGDGDVVRVTVSRQVDGRAQLVHVPVTLEPLGR